jgi:hypothetical protein
MPHPCGCLNFSSTFRAGSVLRLERPRREELKKQELSRLDNKLNETCTLFPSRTAYILSICMLRYETGSCYVALGLRVAIIFLVSGDRISDRKGYRNRDRHRDRDRPLDLILDPCRS